MIIRKYGELPVMYAPDVGEVVLARRSVADRYVRAVVIKVRRLGAGLLEIKLQWQEDDPAPVGREAGPFTAGDIGWVVTRLDGQHPVRIKQISRDG